MLKSDVVECRSFQSEVARGSEHPVRGCQNRCTGGQRVGVSSQRVPELLYRWLEGRSFQSEGVRAAVQVAKGSEYPVRGCQSRCTLYRWPEGRSIQSEGVRARCTGARGSEYPVRGVRAAVQVARGSEYPVRGCQSRCTGGQRVGVSSQRVHQTLSLSCPNFLTTGGGGGEGWGGVG